MAIPTSRQTPPVHASYLWLAGNEGMEKKIETGILGLGFRRNGKDNGKYCQGLYSSFFSDEFLHSKLIQGQAFALRGLCDVFRVRM